MLDAERTEWAHRFEAYICATCAVGAVPLSMADALRQVATAEGAAHVWLRARYELYPEAINWGESMYEISALVTDP